MKTSWTAATLFCSAFLVGCGDSTPENTQNFEQNAPAAAGRRATAAGYGKRARPYRDRRRLRTGQRRRHSTRARRAPGRNAPGTRRRAPSHAAGERLAPRPAAAAPRARPAPRFREVTAPAGHCAAARAADGGVVRDRAGRNAGPRPAAASGCRRWLHGAAGGHRAERQRHRRRPRRTRSGTFAPRLPVHRSRSRWRDARISGPTRLRSRAKRPRARTPPRSARARLAARSSAGFSGADLARRRARPSAAPRAPASSWRRAAAKSRWRREPTSPRRSRRRSSCRCPCSN